MPPEPLPIDNDLKKETSREDHEEEQDDIDEGSSVSYTPADSLFPSNKMN